MVTLAYISPLLLPLARFFALFIGLAKNFVCSWLLGEKKLLLTPHVTVGVSESAARANKLNRARARASRESAVCSALYVGVTRQPDTERGWEWRSRNSTTPKRRLHTIAAAVLLLLAERCRNIHVERYAENNAQKWVYAEDYVDDNDDDVDCGCGRGCCCCSRCRLLLLPGNDVFSLWCLADATSQLIAHSRSLSHSPSVCVCLVCALI